MKPETYKNYRFFMKIWHGYLLPLLLLGIITAVIVLFYRDISSLSQKQEKYVTEHSAPQEKKMDEIDSEVDDLLTKMDTLNEQLNDINEQINEINDKLESIKGGTNGSAK